MKKIIGILAGVVILVLVVLRLMSNHEKINSQKSNQSFSELVSVNVVSAKKMNSTKTTGFTGVLSTDKEINIASEMQGKITSVNCEPGQQKESGSIIATIDDKLKQLAYQSAKINYDKLKKDLERSENLYKGGTLSEQELDNARTNYQNAKNQMEQAEKQLSYTKISAPISGVITQKFVEIGAYVNIGSPIACIVNVSKLKVKLNVSESQAYSLKMGEPVKINTDVYPGTTFDGKIQYISPKGDAAHNYPVEIEIANSSKYPLKAGTFVTVTINSENGSANSLYIPRETLLGSSKDASVYVAENGMAKLRKIVIGSEGDQYLEVLSGLNEGELVVITGQINLAEGKSIKIINNN
jgi:membrane fusion protein, multidrug efflux system